MGYKILCIDDSRAVHAFLKDAFREKDVEITSVYDGKQGVSHFQEKGGANSPYQLIFLDWEMPELTGPETYDALRKLEVKTPVIMLTSKNDISDIAMMLDKGVSEYVIKPFTKDIIIEKAKTIIPEL